MTNSISVHLYKFTRIQHAISVQIFSYKFEKKLYSYVCKLKTFSRVQAVQERLRVDKDNARFEIAALFELPVRREKKRANLKTCIDLFNPESRSCTDCTRTTFQKVPEKHYSKKFEPFCLKLI